MFDKKSRNDVEYYISDMLQKNCKCRHGFSTRTGGVSGGIYSSMNFRMNCDDTVQNIKENFSRFASAVGVETDRLVLSHQVHETNVVYVTEEDCGNGLVYPNRFNSADALITDRRSVPVMAFYADCVPVLLCERNRRAAAAVHSGWRGTVGGITEKTVKKMCNDFGCVAENIFAAIGPSIHECCYEVGEEVAQQFEKEFGRRTVRKKNGSLFVDMQTAITIQLLRCGVPAENIDESGICTCCNHTELFSHRKTNGQRGVMGAVIVLD